MNVTNNLYIISQVIGLSGEDQKVVQGIINPNSSAEVVEQFSKNFHEELETSGKRYRFTAEGSSYKDKVINAVFKKAFKKKPKEVLEATKSVTPLWQRVVFVEAPRAVGNVLDSPVLKIIACTATCIAAIAALWEIYVQLPVAVAHCVPIIIKYTPIEVIQAGNWIAENGVNVLLYSWLATVALQNMGLPEPYQGYVVASSTWIWNLIPTTSGVGEVCVDFVWGSMKNVWDGCTGAGTYFKEMANRAERDFLALNKQHAYTAWKEAIAQMPVPA